MAAGDTPVIEVRAQPRRLCTACFGDTERVIVVGTRSSTQTIAICVDCAWKLKEAIDRGY